MSNGRRGIGAEQDGMNRKPDTTACASPLATKNIHPPHTHTRSFRRSRYDLTYIPFLRYIAFTPHAPPANPQRTSTARPRSSSRSSTRPSLPRTATTSPPTRTCASASLAPTAPRCTLSRWTSEWQFHCLLLVSFLLRRTAYLRRVPPGHRQLVLPHFPFAPAALADAPAPASGSRKSTASAPTRSGATTRRLTRRAATFTSTRCCVSTRTSLATRATTGRFTR